MSTIIILTVTCTLLSLLSAGCIIYAVMCNLNAKNLRDYADSLRKNNTVLERFTNILDDLYDVLNYYRDIEKGDEE